MFLLIGIMSKQALQIHLVVYMRLLVISELSKLGHFLLWLPIDLIMHLRPSRKRDFALKYPTTCRLLFRAQLKYWNHNRQLFGLFFVNQTLILSGLDVTAIFIQI